MRWLAVLVLVACDPAEPTDTVDADLVDAVTDGITSDGAPDGVPDATRDAPPDGPPDAPPEDGQVLVSPTAVNHGLVEVGDLRGRRITVTNASPTAAARLDSIAIAGTGFTMSTTCGAALPPASSCTIDVEISPQELIVYSASVTVTSSGLSRIVPLSATGAWALTVTRTGIGDGIITSLPAGLACRDTCTGLFPADVQLEAVADPGSFFSWWSLPGCSGARCLVPAAIEGSSVVASFTLGRGIEVTREGSGTITSSPAGIDCGSTCSGVFVGEVTLTATPYLGQTFLGWSELTCGTSLTCVIPAGTDSVAITARFTESSTSSLDLELAGDGDGEVVVYREGSLVGRCTRSCSLIVPAGEIIVAAATPYHLESLSGPECVRNGDRCIFTPPGYAQITATFRSDAADLWTFVGDAGEEFSKGAFDAAGNLIAGSQQRIIKLGPTGALIWERPWSGGELLVAPSGDIYASDLLGTVKLEPAGTEVWVRAGDLRALDASGNVLVVEVIVAEARMTLYRPDGTPLWNAPGNGIGIDGAGIIYEPFIELELDEGQGHYHRILYFHRYDAAGTPLPDTGSQGSIEEWGEYQIEVTANRLAVLERDEWIDASLRLRVVDLATNQTANSTDVWRGDGRWLRGFIAGADDDIGFVHDPDDLNNPDFGGYGYVLARLHADGTIWRLTRFPSVFDGYPTYYGPHHAGVAGGPGGKLAMLGSYRPFHLAQPTGPDVGLIQAFAP